MSKREKSDKDWKSGSDAFFRAARADHDASAADFARVEAELARRLAADALAQPKLEQVKPAATVQSASSFASGKVAKVVIGMSLLAAGSFALTQTPEFMRTQSSTLPAESSLEQAPVSGNFDPPPSAADARAGAVEQAKITAASSERRFELPEAAAAAPEPPTGQASRARVRHRSSARSALRDAGAPNRPSISATDRARSDSKAATTPENGAGANAASPAREPALTTSPAKAGGSARSAARSRTEAALTASPAKAEGSAGLVSQPPAAAVHATSTRPAKPSARTLSQSQMRRTSDRPDDSEDARAELALIERMHAAMRVSKPADALKLCAEHAERWPQGVFTEEREAVHAIAACALRTDDAASRAQLFLRQHPRAPTAPRVAAACAPLLAANERATSK